MGDRCRGSDERLIHRRRNRAHQRGNSGEGLDNGRRNGADQRGNSGEGLDNGRRNGADQRGNSGEGLDNGRRNGAHQRGISGEGLDNGVAVVATVWTTGAVVAARVLDNGRRGRGDGVDDRSCCRCEGLDNGRRGRGDGVDDRSCCRCEGLANGRHGAVARVCGDGVAVRTTGAVVAATVWATGRAAALFTFTAAAVVDNTWLRGSAPLVSAAAGEAVDGDDPSTAAGVGGEEVDPTFVPMAEDADFAGSFMDGVAGVEGTRSEVVANDEPVTELTVPVTLEVRGVSSTPSAPAFPEQNNTTPMSGRE